MDRGVDVPWLGGQNTMDRGVDIYVPWGGARSKRFRILARKIEFGVFRLFRMRKKIFS